MSEKYIGLEKSFFFSRKKKKKIYRGRPLDYLMHF
jgi:hypothetical protein